ncbi:MAG: hypothetical protein FJ010_10335 [Chloroflexi bacterium]|nr:hypothetical protein [Chloroflexota bacterium]
MLPVSVSVSVQSVGRSKSSLKSRPPTPGRNSGVGEGTTIGAVVGVSVGGNQITVGVGVSVAVGVAEAKGVSADMGKQPLSRGMMSRR